MKHSKCCPKCGNTEVIRIEGVQGGFGSGNVIPTGGFTIASSIEVTPWVCARRGFSEEWMDDYKGPKRLRKLADRKTDGMIGYLQSLCGNPTFEKLSSKKEGE